MATTTVKQGDAYSLPLDIALGTEPLNLALVDTVEVMLGPTLRKAATVTVEGNAPRLVGDLDYNAATGELLLPLTQEETFSLPADDAVQVDLRVKFVGGEVIGAQQYLYVMAQGALSTTVL